MSDPAVIAYEATVANGNLAYVYGKAGTEVLPLVVLIHGSHVHPRHYSRFARLVAAEGFVVIAPEQVREFMGSTAHYPEQAFVNWGVALAEQENVRADSPLRGRIDTSRLLLTGHSMGGGTTLGIVADVDQPGLVVEPWSRPPQLVAAVVHGTHNIPPPRTGPPVPVENKVPLAFLQGTDDGVVTRDQAERTFRAVSGVRPRLYVELEGATHFYPNDDEAPEGANLDRNGPASLDQATSIASAARWTTLWFRANLDDPVARDALRRGPGPDEPHLRVEYEE